MGLITLRGSNVRGSDLIAKHQWFIVLGRCKFNLTDFPWADEAVPDSPSVAADWPDEDMNQPSQYTVCVLKCDVVSLAHQQIGGPIEYNGDTYELTTSSNANYVYFEANLNPVDFKSDGVGEDLEGYRRISLRADMLRDDLTEMPHAMRAVQASDLGTLLYYDNRILQLRASDNSERHVIRIILPQ